MNNDGAAFLPGADSFKAVVSTGVSTRRIQDGRTITVDGSTGTVTLN